MDRRSFLKVLSGAGAAAAVGTPLFKAFADPAMGGDEYFIMIHAQGAWDVTVGLDPRNQRQGLVEPASTNTITTSAVRLWQSMTTPLDGVNSTSGFSYQMVTPPDPNSPLQFGPGIGDMLRHYDRMQVINGIAMNTVAHPDGTAFSSTGRHLAGSKPAASSIDTMMADYMGAGQLLPVVSVNYPSYYVGSNLDRRVVPLSVSAVTSLGSSLNRSAVYENVNQRDSITAVLSQEAADLAGMSADGDVMNGMHLQFEGLRRMNGQNLLQAFSQSYLQSTYNKFNYGISMAVNAAFAVEMLKRNAVRVVSFAYGSFDTHFTNYRQQPQMQQNLFDTLAILIDYLDATQHPTIPSDKLTDHTHIMVVSDFCRTPGINVNQGRDHYPNNSSVIISPRFRSNFSFGQSDPQQLLPLNTLTDAAGPRPISPPDILRTFVSAFGADPSKYLRDGMIVPQLLK